MPFSGFFLFAFLWVAGAKRVKRSKRDKGSQTTTLQTASPHESVIFAESAAAYDELMNTISPSAAFLGDMVNDNCGNQEDFALLWQGFVDTELIKSEMANQGRLSEQIATFRAMEEAKRSGDELAFGMNKLALHFTPDPLISDLIGGVGRLIQMASFKKTYKELHMSDRSEELLDLCLNEPSGLVSTYRKFMAREIEKWTEGERLRVIFFGGVTRLKRSDWNPVRTLGTLSQFPTMYKWDANERKDGEGCDTLYELLQYSAAEAIRDVLADACSEPTEGGGLKTTEGLPAVQENCERALNTLIQDQLKEPGQVFNSSRVEVVIAYHFFGDDEPLRSAKPFKDWGCEKYLPRKSYYEGDANLTYEEWSKKGKAKSMRVQFRPGALHFFGDDDIHTPATFIVPVNSHTELCQQIDEDDGLDKVGVQIRTPLMKGSKLHGDVTLLVASADLETWFDKVEDLMEKKKITNNIMYHFEKPLMRDYCPSFPDPAKVRSDLMQFAMELKTKLVTEHNIGFTLTSMFGVLAKLKDAWVEVSSQVAPQNHELTSAELELLVAQTDAFMKVGRPDPDQPGLIRFKGDDGQVQAMAIEVTRDTIRSMNRDRWLVLSAVDPLNPIFFEAKESNGVISSSRLSSSVEKLVQDGSIDLQWEGKGANIQDKTYIYIRPTYGATEFDQFFQTIRIQSHQIRARNSWRPGELFAGERWSITHCKCNGPTKYPYVDEAGINWHKLRRYWMCMASRFEEA